MFILSFYLFLVGYGILLLTILPVQLFEYDNPLWYFFVIISLIVGWVLSLSTQLFISYIYGLIRTNTSPNSRHNHRFGNSILRLGVHLMRVKLIVTGKEHIPPKDKQFVVVGNHQENYDILIVKPIFKDHNLSFIAKAALKKLPIYGRWIRIIGGVFISPDADRSAAESIITAVKQFKMGMCMGIFPEGKRSFGNEMIEFKPGAFKLAMKPHADILIATQYNTCTIFKKFPWRRYRVYVHVHELIPYDDYKHMNSHELSDHVKGIIQIQLDAFAKQLA